jgi:hypothetical protein
MYIKSKWNKTKRYSASEKLAKKDLCLYAYKTNFLFELVSYEH